MSFKKYKKSIIIASLAIIILGLIAIPKVSTKSKFDLKSKEYILTKEKANKGDITAIKKLYFYYQYSKNDYKKAIKILRKGAKLGDAELQYRLSLYFIRDYYPYGQKESFKDEGIYWLKKSASSGYIPAIKELKKIIKLRKIK